MSHIYKGQTLCKNNTFLLIFFFKCEDVSKYIFLNYSSCLK